VAPLAVDLGTDPRVIAPPVGVLTTTYVIVIVVSDELIAPRGVWVDVKPFKLADKPAKTVAAFVIAIDLLVTMAEKRLLVWRPVAADSRP